MSIDKDAIIASLQKENEYLKGLLRSHNISFGEIEESPSLQDNSSMRAVILQKMGGRDSLRCARWKRNMASVARILGRMAARGAPIARISR